MEQTRPTLQTVMSMVSMLPFDDQVQLVNRIQYNLSLFDEKHLIDANWEHRPMYSLDEAFDKAYKHLGQLYGLNDIREAR